MSVLSKSLLALFCLCCFIHCASSLQEKSLTNIPNKSAKTAQANYTEYCASCHGADAKAFADRRNWVHGSHRDSLIRVIAKGLEDEGMPSFEASFSEEETAALADYIIAAKDQVATYAFDNQFDEDGTFEYNGHSYSFELVSEAADIPWGITQAQNGDLFIADIAGTLYRRQSDGSTHSISGVPEVFNFGQGGLLDVSLDPDFINNQFIYLSYSKRNPSNQDEGTTAVYRGRLSGDEIVGGEDIWIGLPYLPTKYHFGSRMIWDNDGLLYISIGDRGKRDVNPQDLSLYPGKIHRIHSDGSIPKDNPFVNTPGAIPSIYSFGHRNPQGLSYDRKNHIIYENEHGPRGGDEINIIKPGINYGWPVISYGINYNGTVFTEETRKDGLEQPIHYWVPAIGVCGMAFIDSPKYPDWQGALLSGSLKYKYLELSKLDKMGNTTETQLFPNIGRLRSVIQGQDGFIYIGVENPGKVYRILPQ